MGLDISKITNEALKALAFINDKNNDNKLTEEEFGIFKQAAAEKLAAGECTAEEFNEVMGLYMSEDVKSKKAPKEPKEKLTQDEKNEQRQSRDRVLAALSNMINGSAAEFSDKNIIERLDEEIFKGDTRYATIQKDIETIYSLLQEHDYNHKEVIKAMKGQDMGTQFHMEVLSLLEDYAGKERILSQGNLTDKQKGERDLVMNHLTDIIMSGEYESVDDIVNEIKTRLTANIDGQLVYDEKYNKYLAEIKKVAEMMPECKTFKEIDEKAHNDIIKEMKDRNINDKFHKDILNALEAKAKASIIDNAYSVIYNEYKNRRNADANATDEAIMEKIKDDIKKGNIKVNNKPIEFKDEYKYAFESFKSDYIMPEAIKVVKDTIFDQYDPIKWRKVRKAAKDSLKSEGHWVDKYIRRAWYDERYGDKISGTESMRTAYSKSRASENKVESKKIQTEEEILEALGTDRMDIFAALEAVGLIKKLNDGRYDLSALSNNIGIGVGADNEMNRPAKIDKYLAEKVTTKTGLEAAMKLNSLTEQDVKKLVKLCGYDIEGINWKQVLIGGAFGLLSGIASGSLALAGTPSVKHNNYKIPETSQHITIPIDSFINTSELSQINSALAGTGVSISEIGGNIDILITSGASILKVVTEISPYVLKGALLGALVPLLTGMLSGLEAKGEVGITKISGFENSTYDEYVAAVEKESPKYADIIKSIAYLYVDQKTNEWNKKDYFALLNNIASPGGKLNRNELIGLERDIHDKKIIIKETDDKTPKTPEEPEYSATVSNISTLDVNIKTNLTYVHEREYGDTWAGLVTAYYPELVEKYGLYGKDGAIKRLQRELCTDKNGVYNAELFKDLISRTNLPEKIKMPYEIAGFKRVLGTVVAATAEELGSGTGKGGMKIIGRDEIRVEKIPGTNKWKAVDNTTEEGVAPAYGNTKEEAIANLETATGKKYDKIIEQ